MLFEPAYHLQRKPVQKEARPITSAHFLGRRVLGVLVLRRLWIGRPLVVLGRAMTMGYGAAEQHSEATLDPLHQSGVANTVTESIAETPHSISSETHSSLRPTRRTLVLAAAGAAALLMGAVFQSQSGGSASNTAASFNSKVSESREVPQTRLPPVHVSTTGSCKCRARARTRTGAPTTATTVMSNHHLRHRRYHHYHNRHQHHHHHYYQHQQPQLRVGLRDDDSADPVLDPQGQNGPDDPRTADQDVDDSPGVDDEFDFGGWRSICISAQPTTACCVSRFRCFIAVLRCRTPAPLSYSRCSTTTSPHHHTLPISSQIIELPAAPIRTTTLTSTPRPKRLAAPWISTTSILASTARASASTAALRCFGIVRALVSRRISG